MDKYRSSSAAHRAIRQFQAKNGKSNFIVEKLGKNEYKVVETILSITSVEFFEKLPSVQNISNKIQYRYFPDGVKGEGYYELKTGNRRRPNSIMFPKNEIFDFIVTKHFETI
jgi:hypothetical protein